MPVNTASLKTFAPAMRRQLLEAVGRKLDLLLNSQTPDTLSTYAQQIAELREQEAENREQLLERVAYTWFNRLCALRYLDAKGWHPFGCKVLMPAAEGETQPELLKLMRAGSLPGELKAHTNEARLHGLLDGQIPPAIAGADPQGEVYRELVLASCRSYHQLLPELFEGLDDASELLLPDDLLSEGSIAGGFRSAISDEDCEDVEIIGWLYQFYISEKKDQVIGKVVKSEDIPAATQLFTPNWIVKYMVQNTIGAKWLATYPDSPLREQMEYYIEPAEQTDEVKGKLAETTPTSLCPEELTLMDPACGSGHILVEAYEIFKAIYLEKGYQLREIPRLIFEKNLFGLDIDQRAAQLATFVLLMKGRADDRRLFDRVIELNIITLKDSSDFDALGLARQINILDYGLQLNVLSELKSLFHQATTYGSLIQVPERLLIQLSDLKEISEAKSQDLFLSKEVNRLSLLVKAAEFLAIKHDAVVANPPYMGAKYMTNSLKDYLKAEYPGSSQDLFAAFIRRAISACNENGLIAFVCPYVWMYLSTYEDFRAWILRNSTLASLIQLEFNAFQPAMVSVASFTLKRLHIPAYKGGYIDLSDFKGHQNQSQRTLEAINNKQSYWFYQARPDDFFQIPGSPVSCWASKQMRESFSRHQPLRTRAQPKHGMSTGNNSKYLRQWHEVNYADLITGCASSNECKTSSAKWYPYNKGGGFRKWYGFRNTVINWRKCGLDIKSSIADGSLPGARIVNESDFFRPCITWGDVTAGPTSFRYSPPGALFDGRGSSAFPASDTEALIGFLNSCVARELLKLVNPTLTVTINDLSRLPVAQINGNLLYVSRLIDISTSDWNNFERSWDFSRHSLVSCEHGSSTLHGSWLSFRKHAERQTQEARLFEEKNNEIFIEAYDIGGQVSPEVRDADISLSVNPSYRYAGIEGRQEQERRFQRDTLCDLLSFAVGCMMGRYSLDHPGLILADPRASQAEQLAAYEAIVGKSSEAFTFQPDPDGIIPVLDGEWFEDDIVARTREFLAVTFPESSVTENLRFIEESLGKDIRKYFCSEFYKDHLQTYKKRPIYWMVQSPKKGFSCLIYLHRYTKDTLNQVLNNYFRPYLQKLEARLAQLGLDQLNDDLSARERTAARKEAEKITKVLKECQAWEQDALLPLAQQRIELNLDDGVKVNYLKLQDVLAPIPGLAAKED